MAICLCPESCKFEPHQCRTCCHVWTLSGLVIWKKVLSRSVFLASWSSKSLPAAVDLLVRGISPSHLLRAVSRSWEVWTSSQSHIIWQESQVACFNTIQNYIYSQTIVWDLDGPAQYRLIGLFSDGGDFPRTKTQWLFLIPIPMLAVRVLTPHYHALGQKDLVLYFLLCTQVTSISLDCPSDFTAAWVTGVSADLFSFPSGYTCCSTVSSSVW